MKEGIRMKTFDEYLEKQLQNEEFRAEYEALAPEREIVMEMMRTRNQQGLSQQELAKKAGIRQSNLSRIETGAVSPTIETLQRIAQGLGKTLIIQLK